MRLLLVAAVVLSAVHISAVHAQENSTGIAITPPLFELTANPGDTLRHDIRVDNLTASPLQLAIDRKDFISLGEEGQAALTEEATEYSLSSWIQPESSNITIPAKGAKTVSFAIVTPANAEPGGHFGSIVFRTIPQPDGKNNMVSQEIGALVLLKVAGQAQEKASIAGFAPTKTLWQRGPIDFETRFRNEGNVQVRPTGTITVVNIFGKKVGSVPIDARTVLPDSVRKVRGTWQGASWPGWYTATVSLTYGGQQQIVTASAKFFIFPYKVIGPILLGLLFIGGLAYKGRHRLGRSLRILFGKE